MAKILIDARLAGTLHAGLGRYTEELLRNLINNGILNSHKLVVILRSRGQVPWLELMASGESSLHLRFVNIQHYSILEQLVLPVVMFQERPDLIHIPHFNLPVITALFHPTKKVVTIHDLLWHKNKQHNATTLHPLAHVIKHKAYMFATNVVMRMVQLILCPSEYVKNEITSLSNDYSKKTKVVHIGIQEFWFQQSSVHSKKLMKSKPDSSQKYLVYVGSVYPHKNVEYLLDVLLEMKTHDIALHIVSARSVFLDALKVRIHDLHLDKVVRIHHHLKDSEIKELLIKSDGFITTSSSEGFGLPALEAMAVGVRVFASDIEVFHELYQQHVTYIPIHNSARAAKTILSKLQKPLSRAEIDSQIEHAKKYSWYLTAVNTLSQYEKLLKS